MISETRYVNSSEEDLIKEAQAVQDACNLSGVVYSFAAIIHRLRQIFEEKAKTNPTLTYSTTDLNRHQVCRLFASKIESLAGEVQLNDFTAIKTFN